MICNKKKDLINSYTYDNGNITNYLNRLYQFFIDELLNNRFILKDSKIKIDIKRDAQNHYESFWHLISEGSDDREFNVKRAERLHWIKHLLTNEECNICSNYYYFEEQIKNRISAYVLCEQLNYIIIFRKTTNAYYLMTAYYLNENKKSKYVDKAIKYKKARPS